MTTNAAESTIPNYEQRLNHDWGYAMDEGDRFFQQDNAVFRTMRSLARKLDELGIPYVVVGGMALYAHGFHRFTDDLDLLVTPEGLQVIHDQLEGRGYLPPFTGSKQLRDTVTGVRIEFLVTGTFPGDGKPKPVNFPDPSEVGVEREGVRYLSLERLIELKLASGMTGGIMRLKDFTDVVQLIHLLHLPEEFVEKLNPYVRDRFLELWVGVRESPRGPDKE